MTYDDRRANAQLRVCTGGCGRRFYFVTESQVCGECWRRHWREASAPTTIQEGLNLSYSRQLPDAPLSPRNPAWHVTHFSWWDVVIFVGSSLSIGFTIGWSLREYLGGL